ncbi:MAG: hypothetical protein VW715_06355 [Rhodospirillales bacterium]|jgi:hypothetical protein
MATWTIATLERNTDSDQGVIVAHWRVTETETVGEDTYTASSYGTCGFTPDPSSEDYIAYADLTEADVIGWCQAELDVEAIEASLTANINEQKNPTTADGVPW